MSVHSSLHFSQWRSTCKSKVIAIRQCRHNSCAALRQYLRYLGVRSTSSVSMLTCITPSGTLESASSHALPCVGPRYSRAARIWPSERNSKPLESEIARRFATNQKHVGPSSRRVAETLIETWCHVTLDVSGALAVGSVHGHRGVPRAAGAAPAARRPPQRRCRPRSAAQASIHSDL